MAFDVNKIPKLPYGQGTISIFNDELLIYKKNIKLNNRTVRKSVYGKTPRECMMKMQELEDELKKSTTISENKVPLIVSMQQWLINVKKPVLKQQSYTRLVSTVANQIEPSEIGHMRYQNISTEDIQELINKLNIKRYSYSTIKKTYDCLNDYFRYICAKERIDNPMLLVVMPRKDNIQTETRIVEFFDQEDIDKFVEECGAKYNTGKYKYRYGYVLAANIYLGLRIGELLALQWKDIDFGKNTIYVSKTLIEVNNPEYDSDNKEKMCQNGISKIKFVIQNSTKKSKNRYVPINSKAKELLLKHRGNSEFTELTDYIISTKNRKTNTIKNISDTIKAIEIGAETKVRSSGTHVLRHTCASLYFRKNVPVATIAQILGHSVEVCQKTYIHFVEEQLKEAASKIDVIEI